ncbi:MAG TPA: hypothetical protein VHS09_10185 [Polyangiaceae bacterium]|nr:hypothetical protein [Polyangiaceae bacterium]
MLSFAALTLTALASAAGCANTSPPDGQACETSGGVCMTAECQGEALPYPCAGGQSCCIPPKDGGK